MKQEFKVLKGTTSEVEYQLNQLAKEYIVNIHGITTNEAFMVVVVDVFKQ